MKLLLDEMWAPRIAEELRRRGYDVQAVVQRTDLRTRPDVDLLTAAQREDRAIVTEDAPDFLRIARIAINEGRSHAGLILTDRRRFWRGDERTVGRLVTALAALIEDNPDQRNLEHWLRS